MPELHFESHLEADQGACFIRVPPETLTALGQRKRAPVKVTINGYTYRTTIAVYGGKSYLGVRREVREAAGVKAGDSLMVGLEYDAELRTVDLPEELQAALKADVSAARHFDALSYTHKRELVSWVTSAKRCSKVASVLLPAPVAPTRATVSPGLICRLISFRTSTPGT